MFIHNSEVQPTRELHKFFRKIATALAILLLVFSPLFFFNLVIDPYGVFFTCFKYAHLEPNKRYLKMKFLLNNPGKFDSFIFGSSRVNFFDPDKIKEAQYFNMNYSNGVPRDHFRDIQLMASKGVKIKNLLIGIDFLSLLENPVIEEDNLLRKPYPITWLEKFHFFKNYLFFRPGWQIIKLAFTKIEVDRTKPFTKGIVYVPIYDSIIDSTPGSFIKEQKFFIPISYYNINPDIKNALREIDNIVRFAKENQINLRFFINPTHITTYLCINLDAYFEALRELVKITDFYDFSGLNSICIDNMNFFEPSHYRMKTGDMIIARLYDHPYQGLPDDFGRYVNKDNIEDQIKFHQDMAENYFGGLKGKKYFRSSFDVARLKKLQETPFLSLDKINEVEADKLKQPILITAPLIKLQGWAIDQPGNCLASEVFIQVDDKYFKASYGQERKDLQLTQNNKKLLMCGWNIIIPTSMLGEGSHTLKAGIISADKSRYQISDKGYTMNVFCTKQAPETDKMKPLNSPMCFAVESINGTDTGYFKFVGNSAYINIAGWVTDALKNSTSGAVIAVLNGQTYSSRIRTERPDLANKLNKPALTHPGWVITIPCSELTNGKQELTFKVVNETETGYYQPKDKLVFYNITSATSENYNKLILSSEKTEFFIDAINGIQPNLVSGAIQIKTNVLFISGWAVDHPAKKLADGVLVVIDGKHFTAHYGTNRPDVAEQYKNPAYKQSGWVIEIPVSVLGAGVHQLTLKIISNNKLSYFNIENQITIKTN